MLWRRWVGGFYPLLVWAADEVAADVTAVVHAHLLAERLALRGFDPADLTLEP